MNNPGENTGTEARDTEHCDPAAAGKTLSPGDLELIRWALSLSPEDRLAGLQDFVDTFWTPRHG